MSSRLLLGGLLLQQQASSSARNAGTVAATGLAVAKRALVAEASAPAKSLTVVSTLATQRFASFLQSKYPPSNLAADVSSEQIHLKNICDYLASREKHEALFAEFHKGELSVEAAAHKVGFSLPHEEPRPPRTSNSTSNS